MSISFTAFVQVSACQSSFVEGAPELNLSNHNAFWFLNEMFKDIDSDFTFKKAPDFEMDYSGSLNPEQFDWLLWRLERRASIHSYDGDTTSKVSVYTTRLLEVMRFCQTKEEYEFGWS